MKFVLLVAGDTIRSIRRHRVLVAFILLSLAGMGMVSRAIKVEADRAQHIKDATVQAADPGHDHPQAAVRATETERIKIRQTEMMFNGLFAYGMSLAGALLALVLYCTVVAGEIQTGTIRVTLAKPVPRWAYLLGRWLGATAILATYTIIAGAGGAVIGVTYGVQGWALVAVPWLAFCGNLILGSVGFMLSLFFRAPVAGVVAWFTSASWFQGWLPPLYVVLPSYDPFSVSTMMIGVAPSGLWSIGLATLYAADVAAILAIVAFVRFRRMEIA